MANPSPGIIWPVETEIMVSILYPCVAAGKIGSVSLETHLQDNLVADKDVKKPNKQTSQPVTCCINKSDFDIRGNFGNVFLWLKKKEGIEAIWAMKTFKYGYNFLRKVTSTYLNLLIIFTILFFFQQVPHI